MSNLTVDELIRAGACPLGIRRWFKLNAGRLPAGFGMREFLANGVPLDLAASLGDPVVNRALENRGSENGK